MNPKKHETNRCGEPSPVRGRVKRQRLPSLPGSLRCSARRFYSAI